MGALYKGFWTATVLGAFGIWGATWYAFGGDLNQVIITKSGLSFPAINLVWVSIVGLAVTALIVWITEYYTGTNHRPVQSIARASQTGHGTNVIQGLAISLESTALPTLVIIVGVIVSWQLAGALGVAFAASAMLALAGMVVALDAYGPVTDNAGGIAEMAITAKVLQLGVPVVTAFQVCRLVAVLVLAEPVYRWRCARAQKSLA